MASSRFDCGSVSHVTYTEARNSRGTTHQIRLHLIELLTSSFDLLFAESLGIQLYTELADELLCLAECDICVGFVFGKLDGLSGGESQMFVEHTLVAIPLGLILWDEGSLSMVAI
jgi:hypothetical protein